MGGMFGKNSEVKEPENDKEKDPKEVTTKDSSKEQNGAEKDNFIEDEDDKKLEMNNVLEEIAGLKGLGFLGDMILSESMGEPSFFYEMDKRICKITYGSVRKVIHKISRQPRTLKKIVLELVEVKEDITLMLKELALLRTLEHPCIIKVYEFFRDDKHLSFISEYCGYGDLYDLLKKERRGLKEQEVAYIMKQLLSVVGYCHAKDIINRDYRLENIYIESVEEFFCKEINEKINLYNIRVGDFKSARTYKNSKPLNKKIGNPYYVAPEVIRRKYNSKCDLWSIGIVMYMLLCGKPPYKGVNDKDITEKAEIGLLEFMEIDMTHKSSECKKLLSELLQLNSSIRISATEAQKHKWFSQFLVVTKMDQVSLSDCFNNFRTVEIDKKFEQAAIAFIIHHVIPNEDTKVIRKLFFEFDKDGDGRLSRDEVIEGFKATNEVDSNLFKKIFLQMDEDNSGYMEFEEFVRAAINKKKLLTDENLDIAFEIFDKDGGGSITQDEIKSILGLSAKFSDTAWNEIIENLEKNNLTEISPAAFKDMMKKMAK